MLLAKNKKALHNYEVVQKFLAGIELKGYEVKAIREGKADFEGAYIRFLENRPFVVGMHVGRYSRQSQDVDDTRRSRALLLNKNEVLKLQQEIVKKGKTAVPLALVLRNNMVKLELAIVKGRKKYEKKVVAKEKQIKKDLEKETKDIRRSEGMTRI
jgi:SsrA-binding protein